MSSSNTPISDGKSPQPRSGEGSSINTWQDAWNASPGPNTPKETGILFLKGICMGTADIIPGVSGGTIAFITGIYQKLLDAIQSVNMTCLQFFFRFQFKQALGVVHLRFLIPLLFGILLAIISTARLMHFLLSEHPIPTWSLFFGLISASIIVVGQEIKNWKSTASIFMSVGIVAAYAFVGLIPVQTPETWWFILFSGIIAICAMILPGISGSFLLLILGKYAFITGAVKNPFDLQNLLIIIIFSTGCLIGIIGFSRFLSYLLEHHYTATMAILMGFMIGAMRKVWPWKEVLETTIIQGKEHILREQNILPQLDIQLGMAIGMMVVGFIVVLLLQRLAKSS
ncbi:DUF368 domain-containing protein [Deltaproteobacteria bacterium TL4]